MYKSIEQLKRSTLNRKPFDFEKGSEPPRRPPSGDVWADAMQNRNYKTVVISIICKILAATYKPPTRPRVLVVDFVNVIKIDYGHYETKREVMPTFQPMGIPARFPRLRCVCVGCFADNLTHHTSPPFCQSCSVRASAASSKISRVP